MTLFFLKSDYCEANDRHISVMKLDGKFSFVKLASIGNTLSTSDELNCETFSAIVVNTPPTSLQEKLLEEYLVEGGAILALGSCAQRLVTSKLKTKYFSSLPPSLFGSFAQPNDDGHLFFGSAGRNFLQ